MTKLILTADIHYLDQKKYTFHIYDTESRIIYSMPYIEEMDTNIDETIFGRPSFRPFGITKTIDDIYIANNNKIGIFDLRTFHFKGILSDDGVVNTHQLKNDGRYIYRCNTSNDSVSKIDMKNGSQIHFDFKTMKKTSFLNYPIHYLNDDAFHINCIHHFRTSLFVLANNLNKKKSELFILDKNFNDCRKIADLGFHCHELIFNVDSLYTFSSVDGIMHELNFTDMLMQSTDLENPDDYFLRGATIKNNKIYIFANQLKKNFDQKSAVKLLTIDLNDDNLTEEEIPELGLVCSVDLYN